MEPSGTEPNKLTRSASVPTGSVVLPIEKGITDIPQMGSLARSQTVQIGGVDKLLGKSPVASKGVLLRTASGYEVALVAPEHLRELQCSVCHNLIQGAVHAPCGHSFCQVHLQGEAGSQNELEIQASRLRELTERGFSLERARQALAAVGDGSIEEAAETCVRIAGLEGRAVRVRKEVEHPKFEWGAVSHESVGVVVKEEDTQAWVSFAEQSSWHCQKDELEIDPVGDMVRPNVRVRVRAGVTPKRGWGLLQVDGVATVVAINGCQARLLIKEGVWSGFINELEAVDESIDPIEDAILRLKNGKASEETLAQLHAMLKQLAECTDTSEYRLMLQCREFSSFINSFGSFAMLRAVGLHVLRYAPDRSVYIFAPAPGVQDAAVRAQVALDGLHLHLTLPEPKVPEQQLRYRVVLHMDPEFFQAGIPVDMVYQDQLRSLIIPAIAPPREGWAWPQRGWSGEDAMVAQMRSTLPQGSADLCREQNHEQATKVVERLTAAGLKATVEEGLAGDPMKEASLETPSGWVGSLARGSRVRFKEAARSVLPNSIDLTSVGVICDQVYQLQPDGSRDLQYYVCLPKALAMPSVSVSMLEAAPAAERIQPGVRVRVSPPAGRDPAYSWGRIQSSDVGVVQRVHLDGKVDVFFMSEEKIWNAALQDLDTENLPMTLRPNCPVCDRPFPSGQQLNLDIAMDAQIRRMKKLMTGARHELNCDVKAVVPTLLRSQTHREELKCNICFDLVVSPVTLPCGHSYCKHHIQVWLLENDSCPICRVRVLHYKDREQKSRTLRTAVPLFQTSLQDEDGKGGQSVEGFELHVNRMLETQVIRFFQDEVQSRIGEVAMEVWEVIERRQDSALRRLRNFLDQFRAPGAIELLKKLDGPDAPLPNTRGGTLLMIASELGLEDVVEELLSKKADPLKTTTAGFGPGTSALQLASGQGHFPVVRRLLAATDWADEARGSALCADALGAAIERHHLQCVEAILEIPEVANLRNCMDLTGLLTAVQAGNVEIIELLVQHKANLEARTAHSGLLVSKAGCAKVNGPYQQVGEFRGRPLYENLFGAVMYCRDWWKIGLSRDAIDSETERFFYSMPAPHEETAEPPMGQWTTDGTRREADNIVPMPPPKVEWISRAGQAATPLLLAAQLGLGGVVEKLLQLKADLHARLPSTGQTALHLTVALGDLGVLRVLKAVGAELQAMDLTGNTALHLACHAGHVKVVQELLEAGPFVDTGPVPSPLELAAGCGSHSIEGNTGPPGSTAAYGDIVKMLLEAKCTLTCAALEASAGAGAVGIVEELIQRGGDVNGVGPSGCPPLLVALQKCTTPRTKENLLGPQGEAARKLLTLGASASVVRHDGVSALMLAATVDDAELVELLLAAGAEVNLARGPESSSCMVGSQSQEWKTIDDVLMHVEGAVLPLPPGVLCPRLHPMERLCKDRCHRRPHCDLCRKQELHSQPVYWTCWPCDHDLCIDCARPPRVVQPRPGFDAEGLPKKLEPLRSAAFMSTLMDGWCAKLRLDFVRTLF
ncbi:Ankyrin-2 (ANK-2) (Ankyrin-B) (Brain ankyrin) (Non-erythroid ankyrin) [Durusdinium trenchii]|uniref:Ankyrin-2 (ANK-2) (Ankyrin-B) (Brain ankyrin) (Non-erythroid ankyrin) n=1 Tax=Durusdinium trenchii TaxID=1381693 RepID=A0ABP0QGF5_9DINO